VVDAVAAGAAVTVGALPDELTTTAAAELLGVSRPTLMKLIGSGEVAAHKVGTHTRLRTADVVAFRRARLARQRRAFEELLAAEDG
jgi:excisionase family DNA binding protein